MQRRGGRLVLAGLLRRREHDLLCLGHVAKHHLYFAIRNCRVSGKDLMTRESLDCQFIHQNFAEIIQQPYHQPRPLTTPTCTRRRRHTTHRHLILGMKGSQSQCIYDDLNHDLNCVSQALLSLATWRIASAATDAPTIAASTSAAATTPSKQNVVAWLGLPTWEISHKMSCNLNSN